MVLSFFRRNATGGAAGGATGGSSGARRAAAARALAAVAFAAAGVLSGQPAAAACGGVDLFERLTQTDPPAAEAIRAAAAAHPDAEGRFWRVERDGAAPSWLFGTFHATEPEVASAPARVLAALDAARVAYVEITPDEQAEMQAAIRTDPSLIMNFEGGTLDEILTPAQRALAERVLSGYGLTYDAGRRFRPWFVQVLTAQPPCAVAAMQDGAKVLDSVLSERALARGIPLRGLETWEESLGAFMGQGPEEQRDGLLLSLAMADRSEDFRRTAIDLYLDEKIMMIWEFGRHVARQTREIGAADALNDRFWDRVVVARNDRFMEAAAADLAEGGAFVAVGALHLGGEGGMLGRLRAQGYVVTRVPLPPG